MFEKEIKFVVDYTLNKLRKEVAHVNMGRLLNSSIHPAIIKYCSAEIDNQIKHDRNKLLTGSFFDYSGKEISKYFSLINEEIRKNYKMKGEDLKKLIIKAASFNANYVVRPGWTLAKFIFNEEKEKTIKDVLNYFNYIYYYRYQIDVLSAFISKRKINSLTQEEFIMITGKIDKEVIQSNKKDILKDGVLSIADFFNEGGVSKEKISPYLIEYYLKDKKYTEAANALKDLYSKDDKQKQPVKEIIARLSTALNENIEIPEKIELPVETKNYADVENKEPEIISGSVQEQEEQTGIQVTVEKEDTPAVTTPEIPVDESYQNTLQDLLEQEETPVSAESIHEKDEPEKPEDNFVIDEEVDKPETRDGIRFINHQYNVLDSIKSKKQDTEKHGLKYYVREEEKTIEESPEDVPVQNIGMFNLNKKNDIFSFLNKKEIDRIVENVFNDDQNEFAQTLDKIIECNSYDNASGILKKVFQTYRVNPYSKDAIMLTSAVANYFNQE